ncbi:MAG: 3-deoxy-D-manno-octulosonic acid transferase [Nitrospinaceae bacterium]|nr:3-deoxy-D-manno-octulosonic acid transferase [Nitrospinaceae bacterium]
MKLALYRMATTLGGSLIRLYLNRRLKRGKEDPARFNERLGQASLPRPDGKLVWMHAASVGESLSILPLIDRLRTDHGDWSVLVTTGTVTSARLMAERLPEGALHQYVPVDRVSYVRRFLEHWKPDLALWVESEFWPNLVIETRASAVPMVVLNGRVSAASYDGWLKNHAMIKRILSAFVLVLAQSERDGERFRTLGAKNITLPGNLKFAGGPLPVNALDLQTLQTQVGQRPRWLATSTHAGEEAICGRVHMHLKTKLPGLLSIIVPRHPERGEAVADELRQMGLNVARRSAAEAIAPDTDIYIADTLGELGLFYRLCQLVFIGKSMVGVGGQNPIEPAQLSCALIFGPDMSNFEDSSYKLAGSGGAFRVLNEQDLGETIKTLLNDDKARHNAAHAALNMAQSEAHVLDRVMDCLAPYLIDAESGDKNART